MLEYPNRFRGMVLPKIKALCNLDQHIYSRLFDFLLPPRLIHIISVLTRRAAECGIGAGADKNLIAMLAHAERILFIRYH